MSKSIQGVSIKHHSHGFVLLMCVAFLLVGSVLVLSMAQIGMFSSQKYTQDILSQRAYYAAVSALSMVRSDALLSDKRCTNTEIELDFKQWALPGLDRCTALIQCEQSQASDMYLSAVAQCGEGEERASRHALRRVN